MTSQEALPAGLTALLDRHFDTSYYGAQLADARARGGEAVPAGGEGPLAHFLREGWRLGLCPNRWFDTLGYLAANPDVAAMGLNPFVHYLDQGRGEGRLPMPFFRDRAWRHPELVRYGRCEYGPVRHILRWDNEVPEGGWPERLAVHLHLFFPEMAARMAELLERLPCGFDLLVSVPEGVDAGRMRRQLAAALPQARRVVLKLVPNRGRDAAPWLATFRDEIRQSDFFMHLHSKKSAHGSYHRDWFDYLGHSLLGSPAVAAQMLSLFASDAELGMVAPAYWPQLRRAPNYGKTRDLCAHLCRRMGLGELPEICPDFPAGSFFCCRTAVLAPLLDLNLEFRDFPVEAGQICGTLAHAVERLLGLLPLQAGLRFDMLAVDVPFEQSRQQPLRLAPAPRRPQPRPTVSVICAAGAQTRHLLPGLEAVFGQSQGPLEVILAASGDSGDLIARVSAQFASELASGRLRLLALDGPDLSAARNAALEEARAEVITYLEAGVLWQRDYLEQISQAFAEGAAVQSLYCDLARNWPEAVSAPEYSRAGLVERPFIELASFAHRRELTDAGLRFDTRLGEGAPWDFILRATAAAAPVHLEQAGRGGLEAAPVMAATSPQSSLPAAARRGVQRRHRNERLYWRQDSLQIALKVPAPKPEFKHRWGDLHLANSLARALEQLGCRTRVDILPDWYDAACPEDDAVLVFRGVTPYEPRPEQVNMMWHISHPSRVPLEEMRGYDHVFVSAYPRAGEVIAALGMQASVMMQCADPGLFHPGVETAGVPHHDLLFVGNSRKVVRWMPQACVERGLPVAVYGAEWDGLIAPQYVKGTHVPNHRLAAYYSAARIVLNDHWADMAAQGFVSNRIMDAGLSGALVISDPFAGEELFMGNVVTCSSATELEEAVRHYLADEEARRDKAAALRQTVLFNHTVGLRARQVLDTLQGLVRDRLHQLR